MRSTDISVLLSICLLLMLSSSVKAKTNSAVFYMDITPEIWHDVTTGKVLGTSDPSNCGETLHIGFNLLLNDFSCSEVLTSANGFIKFTDNRRFYEQNNAPVTRNSPRFLELKVNHNRIDLTMETEYFSEWIEATNSLLFSVDSEK